MHQHVFSAFDALSALIAIFAAWTALDLFQLVREREGAARLPWLATSAFAMGGGIWAMHFIAMLGFDPGTPVRYDPNLTALSFALAVLGTSLAFLISSHGRRFGHTLFAGAVMGLSISSMHYIGMAAIQTTAVIGYSLPLVALSIAIGLAASTAALCSAEHASSARWRFSAAVVLGLAVVAMHYSGMAALRVTGVHPPVLSHSGASPMVLAVAVATTTLAILFLALVTSVLSQRDKLIAIIDAGGIGYWELSLPSRTPWLSSRARKYLGLGHRDKFTAKDLDRHLATLDDETREAAFHRALHGDGEYEVEYFLPPIARWLHFRGKTIRSRSGHLLKIAGVVTDVTDRHSAFSALATSEHRQRLLINELNHRVKNTLSTIQSIAALTARRTASTEEFMRLFEARLIALSDTHNLLTANGWESAPLREIIQQEFRPFADDHLRMEGPDVTLGAEQVLAMGLILHELVTNAAKYGALSRPEKARGRVVITWTPVDNDGFIHLDWFENGGPIVPPPTRKGFGSRLIETSIKGTLKGTVIMNFDDGRLHCQMRFRPASDLPVRASPQTDGA